MTVPRVANRDYLFAVGTEVATAVLLLAAFKLAALRWSTEDFGVYAVARRAVSFLQLALTFGLGISLPRLIATKRFDAASLILGSLAIVTIGATILGISAALFPSVLTDLFFGGPAVVNILMPTVLAVAGILLHSVVFHGFQGRLCTGWSNGLKLLNIGLIPLLAILLEDSPDRAIGFMGASWLVTSALALVIVLRGSFGPHPATARSAARELALFGLPRVPGEVLLGGMFSIPVFALARHDLAAAGQLSFATSLLGSAGSAVAALGVVSLPFSSSLVAAGKRWRLRLEAKRLTTVAVLWMSAGALVAALAAPVLSRLLLAPDFVHATTAIRLVFLGAPGYAAYLVLRNFLDAMERRPINTENLMIAVAPLAVVSVTVTSLGTIGVAIALSLTALGALSVWRFGSRLAGS
ncbi:MAG: lipopolysaccharide biosynthesis protein [Gemmatimonadales bacterium]